MTVPVFEPSDEMVETAARALYEDSFGAALPTVPWAQAVEHVEWKRRARVVLCAALNLVLLDPCPTCEATGANPPMHVAHGVFTRCGGCEGARTVPVWAWLRAAQNSGVMTGAGTENVFDYDYFTHRAPLFRVSVPSTPEES